MTRTDRIVLVALVMAAAVLVVIRPLALGRAEKATVQVELAGRVLRRFPLYPPEVSRREVVELPRGKAVLSFAEGGVRILPMPRELCPRAICSHAGLIRRPGESLVCAPNRLVVKVVGGMQAVDAVAR
ncbi:MAG: NusG domain II-containing protein [Bacteroidota bacterium]